jgi:hypothetical protein
MATDPHGQLRLLIETSEPDYAATRARIGELERTARAWKAQWDGLPNELDAGGGLNRGRYADEEADLFAAVDALGTPTPSEEGDAPPLAGLVGALPTATLDDGAPWYPVECKHGFDACPRCGDGATPPDQT